jgi:hypothetical protein
MIKARGVRNGGFLTFAGGWNILLNKFDFFINSGMPLTPSLSPAGEEAKAERKESGHASHDHQAHV